MSDEVCKYCGKDCSGYFVGTGDGQAHRDCYDALEGRPEIRDHIRALEAERDELRMNCKRMIKSYGIMTNERDVERERRTALLRVLTITEAERDEARARVEALTGRPFSDRMYAGMEAKLERAEKKLRAVDEYLMRYGLPSDYFEITASLRERHGIATHTTGAPAPDAPEHVGEWHGSNDVLCPLYDWRQKNIEHALLNGTLVKKEPRRCGTCSYYDADRCEHPKHIGTEAPASDGGPEPCPGPAEPGLAEAFDPGWFTYFDGDAVAELAERVAKLEAVDGDADRYPPAWYSRVGGKVGVRLDKLEKMVREIHGSTSIGMLREKLEELEM